MGYRLRSIIDLHGYAVTKIKRLSPLIPHPAGGFERTGRTHCVQRTGGSLRVFKQFPWLGVDSGKMVSSRPTHQRVTHTVRPPTRW